MLLSIASIVSLAAFAAATPSNSIRALADRSPKPPAIEAENNSITHQTTFDQLLDHNDPSKGTFSQRIWWNDLYYAGPGSPIVLFTPGEIAATGYTGYLTNRTITGLFAEAIGGANVMVEHRYWGDSSPYDNLTTENLQYLTLEQSIADLVYIAKTIKLPFDNNGTSNAPNAPWVLSGGSYSGALAAWTASTSPGTFWAYHASSAPVEAIYDYYEYFVPIQEGMPQNCSTDVTKVIDYMDGVLSNGTASQISSLKAMFGLEAVEHNDDFMSVLANGPYLWQSLAEASDTTGHNEPAFFQFCDSVEGLYGVANATNASIPGAAGVGLTTALAGYASYIKEEVVPGYCQSYGYDEWDSEDAMGCFNSYNASSPIYTDTGVDNAADRQWIYFLCNQPFAYWQDGAPASRPTIVSRLVDAAYAQRQCSLFFPEVDGFSYGSAQGRTVADVNAYTGGWDFVNSTRLTWTNGQFDPWRASGVSAEQRPGGPLASTAAAPVNVIPGGIHCSDLSAANGAANAGVKKVQDTEIAQIKTWVGEFYAGTNGTNATMSMRGSRRRKVERRW